MSTSEDGQKIRLFRFKNSYNDQTMVEIFPHKYNVYAVKFYLKKHRLSDKRYSAQYPKKFLKRKNAVTGAANFIKTMNTVIQISLLEILQNDELASFGFLGAPRPDEANNEDFLNEDGTVSNSIRYRIYNKYARRVFNPDNFRYIESETSSIMLIRNNKNREKLSFPVAQQFIQKEIIPTL